MSISTFGSMTRKARAQLGLNLKDMNEGLNVSIPYLSAMETGRVEVSDEWAEVIGEYLNERLVSNKLNIDDLRAAAQMDRGSISIRDLSRSHKELVLKIARADLTSSQLATVSDLIDSLK